MIRFQLLIHVIHGVNLNGHTGIPGVWTQVLDAGLWIMDVGLWTLDPGLWTVHFGRWALDTGHFFRKLFQCFKTLDTASLEYFRTESESSF